MLSIGDIDRAWLQAAFDEAGAFAGGELVGTQVEPLESGTTSRARLRLTWAEPGSGPETLFVKVPADGFGARAFGTLVGLGASEVGFYASVRPGLDLPAPDAAVARPGRRGDFALVMDDLAAEGARFPTVADGCTAEHAEAVIVALARVHAALWDSPRLRDGGDLRWVFRPADGDRVRRIQRLMVASALRRTRRPFADELAGPPAELLASAQAADRALDAYRASGPVTLLHGDTHLGNTYALPDGSAGLYDWQVIQQGHGLRDVVYFTVLSTPVELRRGHERAWLRRYLDELAAAGVDAPDEDDAWFHYRLYAVDPLRGAVFTAAMGDRLQPEAQWRSGLERATAAVRDLDSLGAFHRALATA